LPAAVYAFNVTRDWSMASNGEVSLPTQSNSNIGLIVIPSLLIVLVSVIAVLTTAVVLVKRHSSRGTRALRKQAYQDSPYSDYWKQRAPGNATRSPGMQANQDPSNGSRDVP
jgi:hypothetical protein